MNRAAAFLFLSAPFASAQFAPAPFAIAGEHQLSSDLDGGGSFTRSSARIRLSAPLYLGDETIVGISGGYSYDLFDFSGTGTDPWANINRARLGMVAKSDFGDGWSWIALPFVSMDGEEGADWNDSLTFGALGGAWYRYSDRLSIGLGAGFGTRLEDDSFAFPILFLDWKLTEDLTLTTMPPEGLRPGPGASLRWDVREELSIAFIYQFQSDQQRLVEDSLAAAGGVGEYRQQRVAVAATYRPTKNLSLTAHVGYGFGGAIEIFDSSGDSLSERDFDGSLVFGFEGGFRF